MRNAPFVLVSIPASCPTEPPTAAPRRCDDRGSCPEPEDHWCGIVPILDRGRKDRLVSAPPPSEPCRRISRTRLSSQWFGLITSKRIDRPVHGPLLSYTALELQRRHSASDDDLNRDHVLCDRCVFGGCFAASSESSRPARKTSSCSCA